MRDLRLLVGVVVAAIFIGGILFYFGSASLQADFQNALAPSTPSTNNISSGGIHFIVLESGANAISISDRTNYRITNIDDLTSLWTLIYGDVDSRPRIPSVDFSKYEVLAIFDGTHATGGYSVSVAKIVDKDPLRMVSIIHMVPNPDCPSTPQSMTSPFVLLQVPVTTFVLSHMDITSTSTCSAQ